jgi:hypothetical protein
MSETRSSGGDRDGAAELLAAARARLSAAARDVALPPALRLTEWQRTIVSALLAGLVRSLEDELRVRLAALFQEEGLHAALTSAHLPIAQPILEEGSSLSDPGLIAALLRRAEEHRLQAQGDHRLLGELAGDSDPAVAAEAMSLLILQSGRIDIFGEPVMGRSELPAEVQHRLVWTIAAALRRYMTRFHSVLPAAADSALSAAAADLLAGYDEGEGVEAHASRLARRLAELARLDDSFVAGLIPGAGLPLLLAALAVRGGIEPSAVWDLLSAPSGRGAALLLRAAALGRDSAASILLQLGASEAAIPGQIDAFEAFEAEEADAVLAPWRADQAYRSAIAGFGA